MPMPWVLSPVRSLHCISGYSFACVQNPCASHGCFLLSYQPAILVLILNILLLLIVCFCVCVCALARVCLYVCVSMHGSRCPWDQRNQVLWNLSYRSCVPDTVLGTELRFYTTEPTPAPNTFLHILSLPGLCLPSVGNKSTLTL